MGKSENLQAAESEALHLSNGCDDKSGVLLLYSLAACWLLAGLAGWWWWWWCCDCGGLTRARGNGSVLFDQQQQQVASR